MYKSDKQLMREGNYVIKTKSYSTKYALYEEELNDLLEEYPEAYYVISDCNNWM